MFCTRTDDAQRRCVGGWMDDLRAWCGVGGSIRCFVPCVCWCGPARCTAPPPIRLVCVLRMYAQLRCLVGLRSHPPLTTADRMTPFLVCPSVGVFDCVVHAPWIPSIQIVGTAEVIDVITLNARHRRTYDVAGCKVSHLHARHR